MLNLCGVFLVIITSALPESLPIVLVLICHFLLSVLSIFKCHGIRGYSQGAPRKGICNEVQDSGYPGNIKNMGCPHPHKSELGDGTHGAGPLRVVLHNNSFAANL